MKNIIEILSENLNEYWKNLQVLDSSVSKNASTAGLDCSWSVCLRSQMLGISLQKRCQVRKVIVSLVREQSLCQEAVDPRSKEDRCASKDPCMH